MEIQILNGDALKGHFPKSIPGRIIVARECLVDGEVSGHDLVDFFKTRSDFMEKAYGTTPNEYERKSASEFKKIGQIPYYANFNLWFEDDLFCQVNFWFVVHLIMTTTEIRSVHLIRPSADLQFGFGGMDQKSLALAYQIKTRISKVDLQILSDLWLAYQSNELKEMIKLSKSVESDLPFVYTSVQAHANRQPTKNSLGRPQQTLLDIIEQLGTTDFDSVFIEFSKRESIYGFGDAQVRRMLSELNK